MSREAPPSAAELRALVGERFDQHRDRGKTSSGRPSLVLGCDPDSRASAWCLAELDATGAAYVVARVEGGGTPKLPASWQTVAGCGALLDELLAGRDPAELAVAVETQGLKSAFIVDCAELLAWRWRLDTLAQLRGVRCVHVEPAVWMRLVAPEGFRKGQPKGTVKRLYQERAKALVGTKLAKNEDRCAAIGIAAWLASQFGCELRGHA